MPEAQRSRPSYGRWYILGVICLMYLITYLDRVNISTAAPVISAEYGFDKVTMGWIFSAFGWSYALFQVPGGWLSDRFGARSVLAAIVTYWSAMTMATAAATGAVSFFIMRFLFGIGEAGAFPGATRAMQLWYTPQERGFASDPTHLTFTDLTTAHRLCSAADLRVEQQRSFPLPRAFGRIFVYNEFVTIARLP